MSNLFVLSKGIEIICLYWQLKKIIPPNNILTKFRQGFVQTYSSNTSLLRLTVDIRLLTDHRQKTCYLYILFFKIFRLCVSQVLYKSIKGMGFYISVLIVTCGVPQLNTLDILGSPQLQ